jgi:hypothetical protein
MSSKSGFRIRRPSPATVMAFIALVFAMGGFAVAAIPGPAGTIKGCYKKNKGTLRVISHTKKCRKSERTLTWNQRGPAGAQGAPGQQGQQGQQGQPGQDATKLFAYIRDAGSVSAAEVFYGSGVTAVSDPAGDNAYRLTFSRSVENCVVQAVAGNGKPPGTSTGFHGIPFVSMVSGNNDQADVSFRTDAGATTDTAFLVTAFC